MRAGNFSTHALEFALLLPTLDGVSIESFKRLDYSYFNTGL